MPFQGFPSRWKPGVCLRLHPRARLSVPFSIPSPMSSKHLVFFQAAFNYHPNEP